MKIEQYRWNKEKEWDQKPLSSGDKSSQLVFVFANRMLLEDRNWYEDIKQEFPNSRILGCSTAGEILDTNITDDSVVVTTVKFESTTIQATKAVVQQMEDSYKVGELLATELISEDLAHVFVLSEGLKINGTALVNGLTNTLPKKVKVTGGLSADGERFEKTLVLMDSSVNSNTVAAIGFYGSRLEVKCASLGGWDSFGPDRLVTKSDGNILYELDGKSALELYKKYLGEYAKDLPASGLLFPLSIRTNGDETGLVRTILSVDEEKQSMTFAGDIPLGAYAKLMKANFDRLIDGAIGAAQKCKNSSSKPNPELAILISCVGRRMILKQRTEEEVEGVREVLGGKTKLTGFYSYGEISPFTPDANCELHNQTMTITTLSEV